MNSPNAKPGMLYLIPTNLSETFSPGAILPAEVLAIASRLDHYIAENAKSARAFLKGIETGSGFCRWCGSPQQKSKPTRMTR